MFPMLFELQTTLLPLALTATEPRLALPMVLIGLVMAATFALIAFNVRYKMVAALLGAIAAVGLWAPLSTSAPITT